MAAKLGSEQVAGIARALASVADTTLLNDVRALAKVLSQSDQSAFTADDLESIDAAGRALDQAPAARAGWAAQKGRGLFFVFEGLDRSGKSTQSKLLAEHLKKSRSVKWMCFPNRATPVGVLIDLYLQRKIELPDESVHRLFSANRWETAQVLVDDLNTGTSVVCDRYAFSGVAYSAAKGLEFAWCQAPDRALPVPDGVFYMHVDEKVGASRAGFGDERYENTTMQRTVREQFRLPGLRSGVEWLDVDGAREVDVIHAEIVHAVELVQQKPEESGVKPIRSLWTDEKVVVKEACPAVPIAIAGIAPAMGA